MTRELADVFPRVDVPQLDAEVAAAADDRVAAHLDRVDGARVPAQLLEHCARLAVPDADADVFGAGDDVAVVEGEVEDCGGVVFEAHEGLVVVGDGVDDAGSVG